MNETLANVVAGVAGLVSLICFILVLVQMFQRGRTGLGIACIVLAFCCGIGGLVAFIVGWVNSREWRLTNVMTVWTVALIADIVVGVMNPGMYQAFRDRIPIGQ
jgi:hypothetical protein